MTRADGVRHFLTLDSLAPELGRDIGTSDWINLECKRIAQFVEATGCRTKVAVPHLLVSMVPIFQQNIFAISGLQTGLNYGSDRIRFYNGVEGARRVRAKATLITMRPLGQGMLVGVDYSIRSADGVLIAEIGNVSLLIPQAEPGS